MRITRMQDPRWSLREPESGNYARAGFKAAPFPPDENGKCYWRVEKEADVSITSLSDLFSLARTLGKPLIVGQDGSIEVFDDYM